jgi:lyso-ornithine lipid O-acyltransferase
VQPIALRFGVAANGENIAAFVGEETLTHNLRRLLKERELEVELHYCAPIQPQPGQDRASLAEAAHQAICAIVAPGSLNAPQSDTPSAESLAA